MSASVRCPSCGAHNAAGAQWCGQCLQRFDTAAAARPEPARPGVSAAAASGGEASPALQAVPGRGVFRHGDALVWRCPSCDSVNDVERSACGVCATPMTAMFGTGRDPAFTRGGSMVVLLSAVLPGAGHAYAGKKGDAVARGVLFVWTLAVGLLLVTRSGAGSAGVFRAVGGVFVLTAAATWIVAFMEARMLARGRDGSIVPPRALLWATAALTLLLFVGLAAGARTR